VLSLPFDSQASHYDTLRANEPTPIDYAPGGGGGNGGGGQFDTQSLEQGRDAGIWGTGNTFGREQLQNYR
jgi:hypothetical protein